MARTMTKNKNKTAKPAPGLVYLRGICIALAVYLCAQLILTLLLVQGGIGETATFPTLGVVCALSSLIGAISSVRHTSWGSMPTALLSGTLFALCLLVIGLLMDPGVAWTGRGSILLACAAGGSLPAGLLGKRKKKFKYKRPVSKT